MAPLYFSAAAAALPLTTAIAVISDPGDLAVATEVALVLQGTGQYVILDAGRIQEKTGESSESLFLSCWDDAACWRAVGARAGVEQWLLVETVDATHTGLRVVDVARTAPTRRALLEQGEPLFSALNPLFFEQGWLRIRSPNPAGALSLDGVPLPPRTEALALAPGRHVVEWNHGAKHAFAPVFVFPGDLAEVSLLPEGRVAKGPRIDVWWGLGLLTVGTLGIVAISDTTPGIRF